MTMLRLPRPSVHLSTLLAVALAVGFGGPSAAQSPAVDGPSPSPTAAVTTEVSAAGQIAPNATYGLGFGRAPALVPRGAAASGATSRDAWRVAAVNVQPGDRVEVGQELASADATVLQLQVDAAQAAVELAEARVAKSLARPTDQERAKADAVLAQAQQRLDAAEEALADVQAQGQAAIAGARNNLEGAETRLRRSQRTGQPPATIAAGRAAVTSARAALANATATAAVNETRARQAVDAAALVVETAKADHTIATAPSAPDVIAADRSALATARLNLARAQETLAGATIVSPVSGVVSMVALAPGTAAPAGDAIHVQEGPMQVIAQVAESDVASIAVGAPVAVTVAATGDLLTGTVVSIGSLPGSAANAAVVTYPVTVALESAPERLRSGMTATVTIERTPAGT